MNKEEARKELKKAESSLRVAEIISEENEKAIKEIKEDIEKLKAIINKKDDWKSVEVPDNIWQALYEEKALLMADMMHFAYARNEGWAPDWKDENQKWGLSYDARGTLQIYHNTGCNDFIFGIAVKSEEIAQEMLEEFGKRIEETYNKQY